MKESKELVPLSGNEKKGMGCRKKNSEGGEMSLEILADVRIRVGGGEGRSRDGFWVVKEAEKSGNWKRLLRK